MVIHAQREMHTFAQTFGMNQQNHDKTWHRIPATVNGSEILPVTSKVIFPHFQGWKKTHQEENLCIFCHFEWPLNFIEIKIGSGPAHCRVGIYFDQSERSIFGASKWKSSPNFSATRFIHFLNIQLGVCMIKVQIFILKYLLKSDWKYRSTLFSRHLDYGHWQSGNPCVYHDLSTIFLSIWVCFFLGWRHKITWAHLRLALFP